jgi:16S rRNA (guanine527-N7)-methyltransferase
VTMAALGPVLERARQVGFLGPGPVAEHVAHALGYGDALGYGAALAEGGLGSAPVLLADLGAGGGVPSLPLLLVHGGLRMVLVEASRKRASFLVWATVELGLAERAEVWCGRAEAFGHDPSRREWFDGVVARGFGPPASTLECGGPLLRLGGRLVVSEPPGYRRYPGPGVARCGLSLVKLAGGRAVFVRDRMVEPELPRGPKEQARRPLFHV